MLLAMQCNCDSLMIHNEIAKLCAYVQDGMITEEIIRNMVAPSLETTVYMLTNAILKHRTADAMHAVDDLLALRLEMPYLMAVLANSMIDMQRACAARYAGRSVQDVMEDFDYPFRFVVERAFQDSMKQSPEHIAACLRLLCDTEQKMHSGSADQRVLFEQMMIEMLSV